MSLDVLERGLVLPQDRRIKGGRNLDGGIWLDIDGRGRLDIRPDQAFQLAKGILHALGVNVEFEYGGPKPS
jgi:hypothetical protein